MTRLAVFDCDGTLVDSQANICRAVEDSFAAGGLQPPTRAAIRRIVGLSLVEAMRLLAPAEEPARHRELAERYRQTFSAMRTGGALADEPLFEGIAALLDELAAAGWVCGVATGKSDRGLAHILDHHALGHHFVTLQTADRHPSKPDPAMLAAAIADAGATPQTTVMIGDTSFDMAMARAGGARAVGVAWGYHPPHELSAAGAHAIAATVAELPQHLGAR